MDASGTMNRQEVWLYIERLGREISALNREADIKRKRQNELWLSLREAENGKEMGAEAQVHRL